MRAILPWMILVWSQGMAAQVTATVDVVQPLVVQGSGAGSVTHAPGPVPPTGLYVTSGASSSNRASIGIWPHDGTSTILSSPPRGLAGWLVGGGLRIHYGFFRSGSASMTGAVRVRLTSPQPVHTR